MTKSKEILFVSHDANRAGAQIFLYNIMDYLQSDGYKVVLLLANDWGSFRAEFESKFTTYSLNLPPSTGLSKFFSAPKNSLDLIKEKHDIGLVYANTIATTHILEDLRAYFNVPILTHIHELSYSIAQFGNSHSLKDLFKYSDLVIACSDAVAQNLRKTSHTTPIKTIHSFVNNDEILEIHQNSNKRAILNEFGLPEQFSWVCACGNADWRKAPDLFVQIAAKSRNEDLKFAWIGIQENDPLKLQLIYDAEKLGIQDKIYWIPPTPKAVPLINAMDYFLLCSREDPFPLVMLEAALCQKAVLTFKNTGGGDEFVEDDAGIRVNYLDTETMAHKIDQLDTEQSEMFGRTAQAKVLNKYNFKNSIKKIKELIEEYLS